jgi:hypothetical protein
MVDITSRIKETDEDPTDNVIAIVSVLILSVVSNILIWPRAR